MRLSGFDRHMQQQDRNRQHRHRMDEAVEKCQQGDYSLLCLLELNPAVNEILHRNSATKADFERWQAAAKVQQGSLMEKQMRGVCCSCQSTHRVMQNRNLGEEDEGDIFALEELNWVMAPHMIYGDSGPWCEGAGTVPQVLVKNVVATKNQ